MRPAIFFFFFFLFVFLAGPGASQLYGPNRAQTISNIFQIPIQTLTAISNVAQYTRPVGEVIQRRRRPTQTSQQQLQLQQQQQQQRPNRQQFYQVSRAARVAGLYPASDGSFFRI